MSEHEIDQCCEAQPSDVKAEQLRLAAAEARRQGHDRLAALLEREAAASIPEG